MKGLFHALVLLLISQTVLSQDQLAVRINEKGLIKILQLALKYNTAGPDSRIAIIPRDTYKFTLKKDKLLSNPILALINEISDLNVNKDYDFFFQTSDIAISGDVDSKSIKIKIIKSNLNSFDFKLDLAIPWIGLKVDDMKLVEGFIPRLATSTHPKIVSILDTCQKGKDPKKIEKCKVEEVLKLCQLSQAQIKECKEILKVRVQKVQLKTKDKPILLSAVLRVSTKNDLAKAELVSVSTNLDSVDGPSAAIRPEAIEVPDFSVVINGQETELDTSQLLSEIQERSEYFGKKLLIFAAEFIALDAVDMINIYLDKKTVATSGQVYEREKPFKFDNVTEPEIVEELHEDDALHRYVMIPADNTRLAPPLIKPPSNAMQMMLDQIALIIRQVSVGLSLTSISTPANKDLELGGMVNLVLNKKVIKVGDSLGNNPSRKLPKLDLSAYQNNDINLAISEPLINGALDLVTSTGLFQKILEAVAKVPGFSINNVKIHFTQQNSLALILNSQVDLKQLRASIWSEPKKWITNKIAACLEKNNNNGVLVFPIEIQLIPKIVTSVLTGRLSLDLEVKSPVTDGGIVSTFKYYTNLYKNEQNEDDRQTTDVVRNGVIAELKKSFSKIPSAGYLIDLDKYLNQSGVEFIPKSIIFKDGAYLVLGLDIVDIKFNSKNLGTK